MKRVLVAAILFLFLGIGIYFVIILLNGKKNIGSIEQIETYEVVRGNLISAVNVNGVVQSSQTAILNWQTSGWVKDVFVQVGNQVSEGQVLANLRQDSLPQSIIFAQIDLNTAENELKQLQQNSLQQSQAKQALENAQQALENALNPEISKTNAQATLADAQKAVENAQRYLDILLTPPTIETLQQAKANLLLRENTLITIQDDVSHLEIKLAKDPSTYKFWESRKLYKKLLEATRLKLALEQKNYNNALSRYDNLVAPPDPVEVQLAEAELTLAKAQLQDAQREWDEVLYEPSTGDIAVLEAQVKDAQREWDRVKNGPDPTEIIAVEARITAAKAALQQSQISAPFDGTITEVMIMPGDIVFPGSVAFRLDDITTRWLDIPVSEIMINQISNDQRVLINFDAIPEAQYQGIVRKIGVVGTSKNGIVEFSVEAEIVDADERVKPGMSGDVKIILFQASNVLLVPSKSIRSLNGERVVYLLKGDQMLPIVVQLGSTEGNLTEVLSGNLTPGDLVVTNPPPSNSLDGQN